MSDLIRYLFHAGDYAIEMDLVFTNWLWGRDVNLWPWLWLLLTPCLVASARPDSSRWFRMGRTLVAVVACYGFMNLGLHQGHEIMSRAVNANPNATEADFMRVAGACGASDLFLLFLGWLYATTYVGWWEMAWRRYYRSRLLSARKGMGDDFISNFAVTFSRYFTLLVGIFILAAVYSVVSATHPQVNCWFWLYITLIPIIVLLARPGASYRYRLGRLIFAVVICYLLMNLALHKGHEIYAGTLAHNPHSTRQDTDRLLAACDAGDISLIILGLLWSINYVGWWEAVWRLIHARATKDRKAYRYSNILLLLTFIITCCAFSNGKPVHALRMLLPSLNDINLPYGESLGDKGEFDIKS